MQTKRGVPPVLHQFAYDPIGKREWTQMNANTNWYTVNVLNQFTNLVTKNQEQGTTNRTQFAYDPDGNLTNDGVFAYAWDGENRLIEVTPLTIGSESRKLVNDYDYRSRRIQKRIVEPLFPDCQGCSPFFGQTNETVGFLYDAWAMIRETRNETTNLYVYGLDLSGTSQGAGTIGGLLTLTKNEGQKNKNSYAVAYDANGNVTDLVDTNGTLAAHYEYDPYGNETAASGALAEDNPFRFSTKYWDVETGLLYYGYRFYNPELGRWFSRDPFGEYGGNNLMGFCGNNAIGFVDYDNGKGYGPCLGGYQCCPAPGAGPAPKLPDTGCVEGQTKSEGPNSEPCEKDCGEKGTMQCTKQYICKKWELKSNGIVQCEGTVWVYTGQDCGECE